MNAEHYRINQLFMSWIGQWPEQPKFIRFFLSINIIIAMSSQLYMQTYGLVAMWPDWDLVIEYAIPLFIHIVFFIKFFNCLYNTRKIKSLFIQMRNSWNLATFDYQTEILKTYTAEGERLIKTYIVIMYGTAFLYVATSIVPHIFFTSTNQTHMYGIPYHAIEAVLDMEKYYYFVLLYCWYTTAILVTIPIATDSMLITYVQHACGLFIVIGYQLENLKQDDDIDINICPLLKNDQHYRTICESIVKHREVLLFAELLESTYNRCLLTLITLNVTIITLGGVQMVITLDYPLETFRFGMGTICFIIHLFFHTMPGQKLIDHSTSMYQSICAAKWYAISIKARKLLNLMLLRCKKPCQITAGKMCVMSLENFSGIIQVSMSYFTVLNSLR